MSVSLIRDGALGGLIACHHYSGRTRSRSSSATPPSSSARRCRGTSRRSRPAPPSERALQAQRAESAIVGAVSTTRSIPAGLCTPALLGPHRCAGRGRGLRRHGPRRRRTPPPMEVRRIVELLTHGDDDWLVDDRRADRQLPRRRRLERRRRRRAGRRDLARPGRARPVVPAGGRSHRRLGRRSAQGVGGRRRRRAAPEPTGLVRAVARDGARPIAAVGAVADRGRLEPAPRCFSAACGGAPTSCA